MHFSHSGERPYSSISERKQEHNISELLASQRKDQQITYTCHSLFQITCLSRCDHASQLARLRIPIC